MQQSGNSEWNENQQKKRKYAIRFECDGCRKKFKTQIKLNQHIRKEHINQQGSGERSTNGGTRGRPKQNLFKRLDVPQQKHNPLKELKNIQQKIKIGSVNARQRYQREAVWKLISKYMVEKDISEKMILGKEDNLYTCSLGKGLAILIEQISREVANQEFKEELYLLITIYISYVIEETQDQNVLNNGSIALLPQFINLFILYDLRKRTERLKISDLAIFHTQIVVSIISILCRWLNFKKFTHTLTTINEEFLEEDVAEQKKQA